MSDQAPKQHKALKVILGIIAALVILALIRAVVAGNTTTNSNSSTSSDASSNSGGTSNASAATSATPGLNQAANDGKFQFAISSFACGQSQLENDNQFESATAQGQFCVMKLNVKNIGSEAQQFDASAQYVYTADGKQLSYTSQGTIAANPTSSQCFSYPTINPGNSLDCSIAFDVPKGVTPTYATLHDSSFSSGVKVNLQ